MMLSRTAENLFWLGRYMERAENVARLVDAARLMAALPRETGAPLSNEWASIMIAAGAREIYGDAVDRANAGMAVDHLFFAEQNPSSLRNCIAAARENARATRTALTQECWEAINGAWSELRTWESFSAGGAGLADRIDWIKAQSALFRGAVIGTMMRYDHYNFIELGAAIERVDSTARLLDVKYHVLLPSVDDVGSSADHYQWLSLLQASTAQRAYYFATKSEVTARGVAAFLILEPRFPRSIRFNVARLVETLKDLEAYYGQPASCQDEAESFTEDLESRSIDDIFAVGLHQFLTSVIERNYNLAEALGRAYGFAPIISGTAGADDTQGQ